MSPAQPSAALGPRATLLPVWFGVLLAVIVAAGAVAQSAYILRDYWHPDEGIAAGVSAGLAIPDRMDTNWALAEVPREFRYDQYNFSSYHYLLSGWRFLLTATGFPLNRCEIGGLRLINPLLGVVAIVALALAARRLAGGRAALVAAALLALDPLIVQDAHYARCEMMLVAGLAVILGLLAPGGQRLRWRAVVAGSVLGWLIASKITMVLAVVGIPFFLAGLVEPGPQKPRRLAALCALFAAGAVFGFGAGVPYGIAHPAEFLSGLAVLSRQYAMSGAPYSEPGALTSFGVAFRYFLGTSGWAFLPAVAVGVWALVASGRRLWAAGLVSTLIVVWVFFGVRPAFAERSFSPFLPLAKLLAAVGVEWFAIKLSHAGPALRRMQTLLGPVLAAALLAVPLRLTVILDKEVFSGRELAEQNAAIRAVETRFLGYRNIQISLLNRMEFEAAAAEVRHGGQVLLTVFDYGDEYTAFWLEKLRLEIAAVEVAVREGLFEGLQPCSLHTFHSARLRFLIAEEIVTAPPP